MSEDDKKVDYLEVDDGIPGQNYVCLSFISPESIMESKESFKVSKFLQSYCKDQNLDLDDVMKKYNDYTYKYQDELQKDFDERNKFQTNIRGLKVRGTYNTREEAEKRAKSLQSIDSEFHVFVGQVGYWLPWDPCADKVQDEHYINDQLNEMMEKYKENNVNRDIFYEEEKRDKIKAAKEEVLRKKLEEKKKKEEENALEDPEPEETPSKVEEILDKVEETVDDGEKVVEDIENIVEDVEKVVEDVKEAVNDVEKVVEEAVNDVEKVAEDVKTAVDNILGDGKVDESVKQSLDDVDPWMANKMKQ